MSYPMITMFVIYCVGMLIIGLMTYRMTSSLSDYILGGRNINSWVAALSAQASDFSGWLLLELPGAVYTGGFNAIWFGVGLAIGAYLNWQFVAKRLRTYTEIAGDSLTLSAFFENRFRDKTRLLRVISVLLTLVLFLFYTASGLVASGKLFVSTFHIDYTLAVFIGGIVVIGYTFLGGFLVVTFTDFIQGALMFIALLIVPTIVISNLGGFSGLWNELFQSESGFIKRRKYSQL